MPRTRPLGPPPMERPNWDSMNEGQKRYAYEQWMLARVRRGEKFDPPGESNHDFYMNEFNLDLLGTPGEAEEDPVDLPSTQEEQAAEDFINQLRNNTMSAPMEASPAIVSSSAAEAISGEPPAKIAKKQGVKRAGTSLPGTGGNLDGMAKGGSGADIASTSILRPIGLNVHKMTKVYHKKWRFLTSANANIILEENATTTTPIRFALTTGMASIPWEYLFFYMSPAEFQRMLQYPGTVAKHCNIEIKTWNTRVAFQTGDTQTANATLNQNKFIQLAKGFRSIPHIASSNRRYEYSDTEPMLPTGFKAETSV